MMGQLGLSSSLRGLSTCSLLRGSQTSYTVTQGSQQAPSEKEEVEAIISLKG